jgi:hypothetical protein
MIEVFALEAQHEILQYVKPNTLASALKKIEVPGESLSFSLYDEVPCTIPRIVVVLNLIQFHAY